MTDNSAPPAPAVSIDDIRTAFLLGWSIVELRNRILLAALTASMDTTTLQVIQPPAPPQPQPVDPITSYPNLHLSTKLAYALIHTTMKNKLSAEVINAIQPLLSADMPILSSKQGDDAWMTSVWRTLFNRIVTLHNKRFKDSDAKGTIYDIELITKDDTQEKKDAYPYAYLFPSITIQPSDDARKDYPNIGIVPSDGLGQKFKMYELTRRALNCLIILYTHPSESLAPEDAQEFKWWAVENLLRPKKDTVYTPGTTAEQSISDSRVTLKILSGHVIRLLDAWNDYLRENYYIDVGPHAQEDSDKSSREIELTAYEAGCAVSGLSWGVSTVIAPLSSTLNTVSADKIKNIEPTLTQQVRYTFKNVLKETDIAHIQRQILGISNALDDTYYSSHPDVKRPSVSDDTLAPANPDLPSESIRAINSSLDYWQRVAVLFSTPASQTDGKAKNVQPVPVARPVSARVGRAFQAVGDIFSPGAQPAGSPQADTTPPPISWMSMLTWNSSSELRLALIRQSYIWESLILCEQTLSSFSVEKVTQRLITRFMAKVEDVIFNSQVGRQFPAVAAMVSLGIVAVAILVVIILVLVSRNLQNFGTILLFILGSIFGFIGNIANNIGSALFPRTSSTATTANASTNAAVGTPSSNAALEQLGTITGLAGATLVSAFESAYKRILIDFGALNHAVSVADPLLEFFVDKEVKDVDGQTIEGVIGDGYDFLTKVIWTGKDFEEEVDNVVSAAFGPIGAFINGSATSNSSSNKKK